MFATTYYSRCAGLDLAAWVTASLGTLIGLDSFEPSECNPDSFKNRPGPCISHQTALKRAAGFKLVLIRGYIHVVYFNDISPHPWSLSLPLVVRVGVQYGGGHVHWPYPEECLTTDEKKTHVYMNMVAITYIHYVIVIEMYSQSQ